MNSYYDDKILPLAKAFVPVTIEKLSAGNFTLNGWNQSSIKDDDEYQEHISSLFPLSEIKYNSAMNVRKVYKSDIFEGALPALSFTVEMNEVELEK